MLFLPCVMNRGLLDEQERVHKAVERLAVEPWPYFEPENWVPHMTIGMPYTPEQLARALPEVLDRLPMEGTLDHGGVEDGTTGENWPSPSGGPATPER